MQYFVAVHGGAGFHSVEDEKYTRKALRRACIRAVERLSAGGSACIAVEESISELEDAECLNAGFGSNLTDKGTVECDASIMDDAGHFGSVGALAGVKNPIRVAKAILDHSCNKDPMGRVAPLTLVSSGAHEFASSSDILTVEPSAMISPRAQREWISWTERVNHGIPQTSHVSRREEAANALQDTVGSISLDASGSIAAGVSSGGLLLKLPGRVGEAAIFGAGCWAQRSERNTGVACSVSGTGEAIIRASLARSLGASLSHSPDDPHEEIRHILTDNINELKPTCIDSPYFGVIILTKDHQKVRLWCAFNTDSMAIAYASSFQSIPKVKILRRNESGIESSNGDQPFYMTVLPWTDE